MRYYKAKSLEDLPKLMSKFYGVNAKCPLMGTGLWGVSGSASYGLVSCTRKTRGTLLWCDAAQGLIANLDYATKTEAVKRWRTALGADTGGVVHRVSHARDANRVPTGTVYDNSRNAADTLQVCGLSGPGP